MRPDPTTTAINADVMAMLKAIQPSSAEHGSGIPQGNTMALLLEAQQLDVDSYAADHPQYSRALRIYETLLKSGRTADALVGLGRVYYNITVDYARFCCTSERPPSNHGLRLIVSGLRAAFGTLDEGLSRESLGTFDREKVASLHEQIPFSVQRIERSGSLSVLRLRPRAAIKHFKLGVGLHSFDPGQAREEYLTAIKLSPDYMEAYLNVAGTYYDQKKLIDATTWWTKGLALAEKETAENGVPTELLKHDVARAYFDMGGAYIRLGIFAKSRTAWERVVHWDPQYPGARRNLELLKSMHPEVF